MKKLCIIFGGESSEHDISIITGMQLAKSFYTEELEKIYNEIPVTLEDFKESLPIEGETTVSCIGMQFAKGLLAKALGFGFERTHISGRTLWLLNLNTIADLMREEV